MMTNLIDFVKNNHLKVEMKGSSSARPIPTKNYFPQNDLEIRRQVLDMKNKPEYYAGSKLSVYNKYLLIMSYTHAFYFEEVLFNFYYACKSFRKLLYKNF